MNLRQFEAFVSDRYEELVEGAQRVTRHAERAIEHLHDAVEAVIDGRVSLPGDEVTEPIGWVMRVVRFKQMEAYEKDVNRSNLNQRFEAEVETLGQEDAFLDPARLKAAAKQRRYRVKKAGHAEIPPKLMEFTGPMGSTRWRFQTLRDGRLFDERAVRSMAASLHRASQRIRHMGEPGFSHTEFGMENA
jgi:Asp-tRNA(Asn)/Glu-tRNA(Gln) amidotransferase A subunit family amidase